VRFEDDDGVVAILEGTSVMKVKEIIASLYAARYLNSSAVIGIFRIANIPTLI